eukprot:CAMPEP_0119536158 /NCGR_PEP_ID=MMETSP1344-20130328/49061_1 /TAXON_ID=236787 /ORGANISM="Florenciella parvula, Strain CCMP2471" /LENGTH=30 /DNA_ID= /DNA_START= /DNA_END= /DNA_ORIENTATION=
MTRCIRVGAPYGGGGGEMIGGGSGSLDMAA